MNKTARGIRESANDSKRVADLQKVQTYLELYYNQNHNYPGYDGSAANYSDGSLLNDLNGITAALPQDPANNSYCYTLAPGSQPGSGAATGQHYILAAQLENHSASNLDDPNAKSYAGDTCGSYTCANGAGDTGVYCVGL